MDEQDFIDQMELFVLSLKTLRRPNDLDIPHIMTESLTNCVTLPSLKNFLEIKNSSIHGKGVFAKKSIEPNKVISLYPCHGIINGDIGYCEKKNTGNYQLLSFKPDDYKIKLPKKESDCIFIYGNPHIQDEGFVGHLINDSFKDVTELKKINKDNIKIYLKYMLNSIKSDNCTFVQCEDYIYVKTIKYINKGDELCSSYGFHFWSEMKSDELNLLLKEHMLSCSNSQKDYILNLYKQLYHKAPVPSKKIKKLMPYLSNHPDMCITLMMNNII